MSRETMQQALEALEQDNPAGRTATIAALRAALAEQKCPCGDRPADQCPGEWEPGCDLGANEKYAKVAEQAQPVAWMVKDEGLYWTEERAISRADQFAEPLDVVPLYTTPPAPIVPPPPFVPQPLTELPPLPEPAGKLYSYNYTAGQMRDYARAVEAEVLKSMRVGK